MKKFAILGIALALAGCGATIEDQDHDLSAVQDSLPTGCVIHYAGEVRTEGSNYPSRVFYTTCGSTTTVAETHTVKHGKSSHEQTTIVVNDAAVLGATSQM